MGTNFTTPTRRFKVAEYYNPLKMYYRDLQSTLCAKYTSSNGGCVILYAFEPQMSPFDVKGSVVPSFDDDAMSSN